MGTMAEKPDPFILIKVIYLGQLIIDSWPICIAGTM